MNMRLLPWLLFLLVSASSVLGTDENGSDKQENDEKSESSNNNIENIEKMEQIISKVEEELKRDDEENDPSEVLETLIDADQTCSLLPTDPTSAVDSLVHELKQFCEDNRESLKDVKLIGKVDQIVQKHGRSMIEQLLRMESEEEVQVGDHKGPLAQVLREFMEQHKEQSSSSGSDSDDSTKSQQTLSTPLERIFRDLATLKKFFALLETKVGPGPAKEALQKITSDESLNMPSELVELAIKLWEQSMEQLDATSSHHIDEVSHPERVLPATPPATPTDQNASNTSVPNASGRGVPRFGFTGFAISNPLFGQPIPSFVRQNDASFGPHNGPNPPLSFGSVFGQPEQNATGGNDAYGRNDASRRNDASVRNDAPGALPRRRGNGFDAPAGSHPQSTNGNGHGAAHGSPPTRRRVSAERLFAEMEHFAQQDFRRPSQPQDGGAQPNTEQHNQDGPGYRYMIMHEVTEGRRQPPRRTLKRHLAVLLVSLCAVLFGLSLFKALMGTMDHFLAKASVILALVFVMFTQLQNMKQVHDALDVLGMK